MTSSSSSNRFTEWGPLGGGEEWGAGVARSGGEWFGGGGEGVALGRMRGSLEWWCIGLVMRNRFCVSAEVRAHGSGCQSAGHQR